MGERTSQYNVLLIPEIMEEWKAKHGPQASFSEWTRLQMERDLNEPETLEKRFEKLVVIYEDLKKLAPETLDSSIVKWLEGITETYGFTMPKPAVVAWLEEILRKKLEVVTKQAIVEVDTVFSATRVSADDAFEAWWNELPEVEQDNLRKQYGLEKSRIKEDYWLTNIWGK